MVRHAGSPSHTVYVDMTLTRSNVKVKVTEHLNFQQLPINAHFQVYHLRHFRVQLKTDGWRDSMAPGLQLVGARFSTFLLEKLPRQFKLRGMSIFHDIQTAIFPSCVTLQSRGWACWYYSTTGTVLADMTLTQTDDRQTNGRQHIANVNVSSRSLKTVRDA